MQPSSVSAGANAVAKRRRQSRRTADGTSHAERSSQSGSKLRGSKARGSDDRGSPAGGPHIHGLHAASAAIEKRPTSIRRAFVLDGHHKGNLAGIVAALEALNLPVERLPRNALDEVSGGGTHQGIVLEIQLVKPLTLVEFEEMVVHRGNALRLLILDQVEDPRNLGACLRSADAAGVDAVVVPKDRSASLTPVAVKAAAGAAETVPVVQVTNLARVLRWLKDAGVWIVGADGQAEQSLYATKLQTPVAIVLGSEGSGLRRLTREHCDALFAIPMRGSVESLNVSVTAGIVLFESLRQA